MNVLRRWLAEGRIVLATARKLRHEPLSFEERVTSSGAFTFGARGNGHDDYVAPLITAAICGRGEAATGLAVARERDGGTSDLSVATVEASRAAKNAALFRATWKLQKLSSWSFRAIAPRVLQEIEHEIANDRGGSSHGEHGPPSSIHGRNLQNLRIRNSWFYAAISIGYTRHNSA